MRYRDKDTPRPAGTGPEPQLAAALVIGAIAALVALRMAMRGALPG